MRSLSSVVHQIGTLLLVFSLYLLLPALTAIYYREPAALRAFVAGATE